MPLAPKLTWKGDRTWIRESAARARGRGAQKAAVDPWRKWITEKRIIRMYQDKGRVRAPGGQEGKTWKPNAELTQEIKGHGRPMLSPKLFRFGAMVRSYVIDAKVSSRIASVRATIWNRARGKGGFDYPSYLDQVPNQRKPIRPIDAQILRMEGPGGVFFRHEVRRPPSRPHIYFTDDDLEQLGLRLADWILEGRKSSHRRRVPR